MAKNNKIGYHFNISTTRCNNTTYVDDLAIITDKITQIQPHVNKLQKFSKEPTLTSTSQMCYLHVPQQIKSRTSTIKAFNLAQNIRFKNKPYPTLTQTEPYTYVGIHLVPTLKWKQQKTITLDKQENKANS